MHATYLSQIHRPVELLQNSMWIERVSSSVAPSLLVPCNSQSHEIQQVGCAFGYSREDVGSTFLLRWWYFLFFFVIVFLNGFVFVVTVVELERNARSQPL
jgi:hypothetical protein